MLGRVLISLLVLVLLSGFGLYYALSHRIIGRAGYESVIVILLQDTAFLSESSSSSAFLRSPSFDSKETYRKVVEKENLQQRWEKDTAEDAVAELRKAVIVQSRRGTDVFEIKVVDDDPQLAADIAQSIYDVVLESVTSLREAENQKYLSALDEQLSEQRKKVRDAKAALDLATKENTDTGVRSNANKAASNPEELLGKYRIEQNKLKALELRISRKQLESLAPLQPMVVLEKPVPATVKRLW